MHKASILLYSIMALLLTNYLSAYDKNLFVQQQSVTKSIATTNLLNVKAVRTNTGFFKEYKTPNADRVDLLYIELFNGKQIAVEFTHFSIPVPNEFIWRGKVQDKPESSVILSVIGDVISGSISVDDTLYKISFLKKENNQTWHQLTQPDPTKRPQEHPDEFPNGGFEVNVKQSLQSQNDDNSTYVEDGSIIDVMVVYTPAAKEEAGGETAIHALINLAIAETNEGYENSGVIPRIRLVHKQEINYSEASSMAIDLQHLKNNGEGYMDGVHALRNDYKADMVALITKNSNYCGVAYLHPRESAAFQVTAQGCATGYYSFAHEFGHIQGARHDRHVDNADTHSHGYTVPSEKWRTIMSYNNACSAEGVSCKRINHWSNPDILHSNTDTPMGIADGEENSADNRLTLNKTAQRIANFRVNTNNATLSIAAPSTLEATDITTSGATLTWTDNSHNEHGFNIYCNDTKVGTVTENVESYVLSNLSENRRYTCRVKAYNTEAESLPSSTIFTTHSESPIVYIPNNGLRQCIATKLDVDVITQKDILSLRELVCVGKNITNLQGLEEAINLEVLNLSYNFIGDMLQPLQGLTKLIYLNLKRNVSLKNITPLQNLTNLTYLNLSENMVTDITPVTNLTNLTNLSFSKNWRISNITALQELTSLTHLSLDNNQIVSVKALEGLTNLMYLHLGNNHIGRIDALESLINLTNLTLNGNQISKLHALQDLPKLEQLSLMQNYVTSIAPLRSIEYEMILEIDGNCITDLATLPSNISANEGFQMTPINCKFSAKPSDLDAISITNNSATLTWLDNSDNEDGFQIYNKKGEVIAIVEPNVTSYKLTGLKAQKSYTYSVYILTQGTTNSMASVTFKTAFPKKPLTPEVASWYVPVHYQMMY